MSLVLRIDKPGIYDLSAAQYHADPCIQPSFSRSIAKLLCDLSPAHARNAHPRLGYGAVGAEDEVEMIQHDAVEDRDAGQAAHSIFLRGENIVERIGFDDFRTKAAKQARDEALQAGRIPLKQNKYDDVMRLVEALEGYRARTGAFTKGKPERTLIWRDGPAWCRCMVDWLYDDPSEPIDDLKTTSGRAIARLWGRRAFDSACDLQAVFYPIGAAEVREGVIPQGMRFHVVETRAPYGIKMFEFDPEALEIASEKLNYARNLWNNCMQSGEWPSYDSSIEAIEAPIWVRREWDWQMRSRNIQLSRTPPNWEKRAEVVDRMLRGGNLAG